MKKIIGLALAFLLTLGIAVGSTIAYFVDTETSTDNKIMAGTLDLGLSNSSGQNPKSGITETWETPSNWAPGDSAPGTLYLYNSGTVAISNITVTFDYTEVTDGTPSTISPVGTNDTDKLDKMVKATTATLNGESLASITGKTLEELKAAGAISLYEGLNSLEEKALAITWTFDEDATNGCQGDSITFTVTVIGNQ